MTSRPILTLKRKPEPDALAELLDQGSDLDPHNPHKLVQPSRAPIPDLERLKAIIDQLGASAAGNRNMSPRLADMLGHEGSSLLAKLRNAASDNAVERE